MQLEASVGVSDREQKKLGVSLDLRSFCSKLKILATNHDEARWLSDFHNCFVAGGTVRIRAKGRKGTSTLTFSGAGGVEKATKSESVRRRRRTKVK